MKSFMLAAFVIVVALDVRAQTVSEAEIIEALSRRPATADAVTGSRSLDGLFDNRGITVEEGEEVPAIDIRVNFEFDSIRLNNETVLALNALGNALTSEALAADRIEIVGHTDAKGSDEYNMDLSFRRAASVVRYLVDHHGVDPARVTSSGAGESRLILPADPDNELNRRVEIRNISAAN